MRTETVPFSEINNDDFENGLLDAPATEHCGKVFLASRPNTVFCSGQCKNQYNVYKSRGKDRKENDSND